jgi:hypothetical protein
MGVSSYQPLAKGKGWSQTASAARLCILGFTARWNQKEAGGKIPAQGTRTSLGTRHGMSLHFKTKSNKLRGQASVNDVGRWKDRGRSHGREEMVSNHG